MGKTKLLILTSTYPRSRLDTIPIFVSELSMRLADSFDVFVLCPHTQDALEFEILNNCKVYRYRYAPLKWQRLAYGGGMLNNLKKQPLLFFILPLFIFSQIWHALSLCKQHDISIVHAHWIIPQGFVAGVLKFIGLISGYVVTSHGGDLFGIQGSLFSLLKKYILAKASHVTVVSSAMKDICVRLGIDRHRISVVSMGVDLDNKFVPSAKTVKNIDVIFVGRIVEKKGVLYLIKAWRKVVSIFPDAALVIIGDGPERILFEKLADDLGLSRNVNFLGAMPNEDIPPYYQRSHVAVMPSIVAPGGDQEGLGLVAVEAIGCGCQLVASDLPAIRDVVKDGINGRLVPPGDIDAIANAIIEYLSVEYNLKQNILQRHSSLKKMFDWKIITQKYKKIIYSHLCNE